MKTIVRLLSYFFTTASFILPTIAWGEHHEENKAGNNYMLLSAYEVGQGQSMLELQKEAISIAERRESDGFNNCGVYRHQFAGSRLVYVYCYFDHYGQLDAVQKKGASRGMPSAKQSYASHNDNILQVQQRNLDKAPENMVFLTFTFGSDLTLNQRQQSANTLFDAFNKAFQACNLYTHSWGAELGHYISCGFSDFADFEQKDKRINATLANDLADAKLGIQSHKDDMLRKVID